METITAYHNTDISNFLFYKSGTTIHNNFLEISSYLKPVEPWDMCNI